jgi:hypothetical protein
VEEVCQDNFFFSYYGQSAGPLVTPAIEVMAADMKRLRSKAFIFGCLPSKLHKRIPLPSSSEKLIASPVPAKTLIYLSKLRLLSLHAMLILHEKPDSWRLQSMI